METIVLSKELNDRIVAYIENNPIKVDYGYRDAIEKEQLQEILKSENGLMDFEQELYEMNLDYISELERNFIEYWVVDEFHDDLVEAGIEDDPDELYDYVHENFMDYISVDMNVESLLNNTEDINCLIYLYSNYDCTNSFDTMETSDYLSQVYSRVKAGVRKKDFIWEHINGAYGGSLFCFAFSSGIEELIELKRKLKEGKQVMIPKGTQFGFFSSFQGSGSCFEKTTYRNFYLNIKEEEMNPEYDCIDIIADAEQSYSMSEVYGGIELDEQTIKIK